MRWLALVLTLSTPFSLFALVLADDKRYPMGSSFSFIEDKSKKLTLDEVKSLKFRPYLKDSLNFGYSASAYWLKADFKNQTNHSQWYLELVSLIDEIDVYLVKKGQVLITYSTGRNKKLASRPFAHRNFIFPLELNKNLKGRYTLYMRLASQGALLLPLTLYTPLQFLQKDHLEQFIFGLYFGILLIMVLYNLFVFLSVKDRSYLYYLIYVFSFGMLMMGIWGFSHEMIWPDSPGIANRSLPFFINCSAIFGLLFARNFLQTRLNNPLLNKTLWAFIGLSVLALATTLLLSYAVAIRVSLAIGLICTILMFTCAVIQYARGFKAARFFILAFITLTIGIVVIILRNLNILPFNFFTSYSSQIGSALEITLLALALGDRINILREEKAQIQLESLENQQRMATSFARFVPDEFLQYLGKDDITAIELGDAVEKEMAVLFSDIRDFTNMAEKMSPRESFDFVNDYLKTMGPIIRKHNGFIDKFIGDAIMALFAGGIDDALEASIDMLKALPEYNRLEREKGRPEIRMGIGLHSGRLMLGTIGEEKRMDSTVISDAVNLASRIEGQTKKYNRSLLISKEAADKVKSKKYSFNTIDSVKVKGKEKPVEICDCTYL